jgi:hypothetical protein
MPIENLSPESFAVHLHAHPEGGAPAGLTLQVRGAWEDGDFCLDYRVQGDCRLLVLPTPAAPVDADALWRHSCFELFLADPQTSAYREYNFSPSGQWAAYGFSAYRQRQAGFSPVAPLAATWRVSAGEVALQLRLPGAAWPVRPGAVGRLGLSAVLEERAGGLSYWALAHPPGRPDFHRRTAFALTLAIPIRKDFR